MTTNTTEDQQQILTAIQNATTHKSLSASHQQRLDNLPQPVQDRVKNRIQAALTVSVLSHLDHCAQVTIDPTAFERIVAYEEAVWAEEIERDALLKRLVQAGASLPMLKALMGISSPVYIATRKALGGVDTQPSRHRTIDESESIHLYREWEKLGKPASSEGFLMLHEITGQPCRVLWGLVMEWQHVEEHLTNKKTGKR
jgi:hypothetical protein